MDDNNKKATGCPFNHKQRCAMCFIPCVFWKREDITRRDFCLCRHEIGEVEKFNHVPVLMEIGGTWTSSKRTSIPIWWIMYRLCSMIYLLWSCVFTMYQKYIARGYGFWFYFYYLTLWGNTTAMLSTIGKFISTIKAYQVIKNGMRSDLSNYDRYRMLFVFQKITMCISVPALTLVVISYWALIYDSSYIDLTGWDGYDSINVHGITFVPIFIDFLLSSECYYYKNAIWAGLFGCAYGLWTIIFDAAKLKNQFGDPYIYSFLYWSEDPLGAAVNLLLIGSLGVGFASFYAATKKCILFKESFFGPIFICLLIVELVIS